MIKKEIKKIFLNKPQFLVISLIFIDIVFVGLSGIRYFLRRYFEQFKWILESDYFSITKDGSLGEIFQYFKEFSIAGILLMMYLKTRNAVYIPFTVLFLYLLADDSLSIHEWFGEQFDKLFSLPSFGGIRGQDIGELIGSALIGGVIFLFIIYAHSKAEDIHKTHSRNILYLLAGLVWFGVFMCMSSGKWDKNTKMLREYFQLRY
jgi:hypothetical protein